MARSCPLTVLEDIRIASPCSMRWDDMEGDARSRFCGACRLNVYNISEMTREQAEALIAEKEGHLCVRLYRRADGTVLTRNCPVGLRRVRHAVVRASASLAAVLALAVGAVASMGERLRGRSVRISQTEPYVTLVKLLRAPVAPPTPPPQVWMMGAMCIPISTAPASEPGTPFSPATPDDTNSPGARVPADPNDFMPLRDPTFDGAGPSSAAAPD